MQDGKRFPEPARLWAGSREPIFNVLPGSVLANFYNPRSENALLWNLLYPRAQPALSLATLLALTPLWGTTRADDWTEDELIPYYWGYAQEGDRLSGLDEVLREIDGPGPKTEIDLFLAGQEYLIAVEAKHVSVFGRCTRYASRSCPEVHGTQTDEPVCRYWEPGAGQFIEGLSFGPRPDPGSMTVPCHTHYQLARTFMVGRALARRLERKFALWIYLPEKRWRSLEPAWKEFTEFVLDDRLWRRMRVVSWERIQTLPTR